MSLSSSKILKTLFHTPEKRTFFAEKALHMENWGNNYLSLDMTLMTRIIHTSLESLTTHFCLEYEPCWFFFSTTHICLFSPLLFHVFRFFFSWIFFQMKLIFSKKIPSFLRIFSSWWSQLYWIFYMVNGNSLTRRCNQGHKIMSKFIHAHKYMR